MDEYVDPEKEREEQLKLLQSYIGEAEDHMRKRDYKRAMEGYNLVCAYVLCVCVRVSWLYILKSQCQALTLY